jgi:hypothetical protein
VWTTAAFAVVALGSSAAHAQFIIHGVAGRGIGDGGPAAQASLDTPTGMLATANGILIADSGHSRVRLVDNAGNISTFAGTVSGTLGDAWRRHPHRRAWRPQGADHQSGRRHGGHVRRDGQPGFRR